jgi:N-acetylmuramoyl-L-alanine amidase
VPFDTVWADPANAELRRKRTDPNVIFPGDVIVIPDLIAKSENGSTEALHRFRLKTTPSKLRLRFLCDDRPLAGRFYVLDVRALVSEGYTDSDGWLEESIPSDATHGTLYLGEERIPFPLLLGHLDPPEQVTGAQGRLRNLGFLSGDLTGNLDEATKEALAAFQKKHGLTETGDLDTQTQDKLKELHGG